MKIEEKVRMLIGAQTVEILALQDQVVELRQQLDKVTAELNELKPAEIKTNGRRVGNDKSDIRGDVA